MDLLGAQTIFAGDAIRIKKSAQWHFFVSLYCMENQKTPLFLRYGGAAKDSSEMNKEELEQAASSILRRAKEKAFFKGRPIIFSENGKVYEEWPDGTVIERTKIA